MTEHTSLCNQLTNAQSDLVYQIQKIGRSSDCPAFRAIAERKTQIWEDDECVFLEPDWKGKLVRTVRRGMNGAFLLSDEDKTDVQAYLDQYDRCESVLMREPTDHDRMKAVISQSYSVLRGVVYRRTGRVNVAF